MPYGIRFGLPVLFCSLIVHLVFYDRKGNVFVIPHQVGAVFLHGFHRAGMNRIPRKNQAHEKFKRVTGNKVTLRTQSTQNRAPVALLISSLPFSVKTYFWNRELGLSGMVGVANPVRMKYQGKNS